jgi:D-Tyr-tRNA(Tyr) deacylase
VIDESRVIALGNPVDNLLAASSTKGSSSSETAGMLVYVSFGRTATKNNTEQAARTLLNLPILTLGAWGDGQGTQSILQLSADLFRKRNTSQASPSASGKGLDDVSPLSWLLVPQANLTAKVKKLGKSIQYRDQVEKSQGEALYKYFCDAIEKLLIEHHTGVQRGSGLHVTNASAGGIDGTKVEPTTTLDPAISPSEMFRQDDTYGSFEEDNDKIFPVTYANGEPLTKSAMKKLQKIYKAHSARHTKYVESRKRQETGNNGVIEEISVMPVGVSGAVREEEQDYVSVLPHESMEQGPRPPIVDKSFIQLVAGSFGMRQGIEIQSDMGPFCHVVEID